MATRYVSSVDGDNGSPPSETWWSGSQSTYATVAGALASLSGDGAGPHVVYVSHVHGFSSGSTIAWGVAENQIVAIISVNRATGAWTPGATEAAATNSTEFNVASGTVSQSLYVFGCTLRSSTGASSSNLLRLGNPTSGTPSIVLACEQCLFANEGTSSGIHVLVGAAGSTSTRSACVNLQNCHVDTSASTGPTPAIALLGGVFASGLTIGHGGSKRTGLFSSQGSNLQTARIIDSDLSGWTSGNYVDAATVGLSIEIVNCRLHSSPTKLAGTFSSDAASVCIVNCDSGDTHNSFEYHSRHGSLTRSTGVYRDDGAEFDESNVGWQIVTSANANEVMPFVTPWIHRWIDATGELDFDLHLIRDSATDYTTREVWAEFEVLENGSFPVGTLASTRGQPFDGASVDLTNSGETWTQSGMSNPNAMRIRVTRTVAEKSLIRARLFVAAPSTTLYLDPCIAIEGMANNPPTRWSVEGAHNEAVSEGGGGEPSIRNRGIMTGGGL